MREQMRKQTEEIHRLRAQLLQSNNGQGVLAPAPAPTPTPAPEEKVSSLITLETQIELQQLKVEIEQIEEMEKNSLSPTEKRNNIDELEEKISSTEKKFERETKILQAIVQDAKKKLDAAAKKKEFQKAGKYEKERKQAEEKKVALADEHKIMVDELEQKINDERRQLECGWECLKRMEQKQEEYESKMTELVDEKKGNWIQEGSSLTEAVKVLNGLMERTKDLESVKEMVAVRVRLFFSLSFS